MSSLFILTVQKYKDIYLQQKRSHLHIICIFAFKGLINKSFERQLQIKLAKLINLALYGK